MNKLKKIENTITSMEVAEMVEKDHSKLLRDIRVYCEKLAEAKIGLGDFFTESTYKDANNQSRPCFNVTKKGCEFIANKLTGSKGVAFTARYINRFHEMEQQLENPFIGISKELQAVIVVDKRVTKVEEKLDFVNKDLQEFKRDMPLLAIECQQITGAKNRKVVPLLGGKESNAYNNASLRGKVYRDLEGQLRREFGVTSYKAIHRNQTSKALEIIASYELPFCLLEQIENENSQMNFK